ncbi:MAG: hypothetical protein JKY94_08930 [Rhodobacteraceae bacterium]|nr:hypothetical protein [Paracoccaceae bacterium]
MGPIQTLDDVIDMLRRRVAVMLFVICMGGIVSVWVALDQTQLFSSTEVVQVERTRLAEELTPRITAGSTVRRLRAIEQQLMARDSLLRVIDDFDLYVDQPGQRLSEKVSLLRKSIRIQAVTTAGERASDDAVVSAVTVTATMQTPQQAQAMAHEFSTRIIELRARLQIIEARETLDFFVLQEEKLTARVATLERRIVAFRKRILEQVIETNTQVRHELAAFERQLDQLQSQLTETSTRRTQADFGFRLESQHKSERLTVSEPAALSDYPVPSSRKPVVLIGLVMSIIAAFVVALVIEFRNPVIRTARQMQRELGFSPIVSIPLLDDSKSKPGFLWRLLKIFRTRHLGQTQG